MNFRTPYSGEIHRVIQKNDPESLTEQHHKDKCDTQKIVTQYLKTGVVDHLNTRQQIQSQDDPIDFKTAMDIVAQGNSTFESLPAHIRAKFNHSTQEFVEFTTNPKNIDALVELGLANKPLETKEVQTPIIPPEVAPAASEPPGA